MHPSIRTFDRSDLILAWLGRRKYSSAHEDLRNYHDAVHAAFTKAFGIDLDLPPVKSPIPDEDGLHGLFLHVARAYEEVRSPFSNYMCGTREISGIYQKYSQPLETAAISIRNLHMMMLLELAELIWGSDSPHRVSRENLQASGHPGWNAPEPADYW
jgi:hypothetical protein